MYRAKAAAFTLGDCVLPPQLRPAPASRLSPSDTVSLLLHCAAALTLDAARRLVPSKCYPADPHANLLRVLCGESISG